jgi:hypothetical protein
VVGAKAGPDRAAERLARRGRIALATGLMLLAPLTGARGERDALEMAVKATYLYKFAPFVEWPAAAFASPTAPLMLCVVGNDPFGEMLDRAAWGARDGDHPVAVRRLRVVAGASGCHIVYAAGSAAQPVGDILAALRGRPVLTVADAGAQSAPAIIQFVTADNRLRFDIDAAAAAESGLVISSKLLSLAVHVRSRS